jgi:peptidoglycan hydrolase-like protein with peptidoglycan-binding domain
MTRRTVVAALALGAGAAGWLALSALAGGDEAPKRASARADATATVERRTLVARELVDGTLGYADARTLVNRRAGMAAATLTRAARPGSVVRRGDPLYWLDGEPVLLMYGATPAYRTLKDGVADGPDVEQLEANLAALGFYPGTVDEEFTSTTAEAVRDWQESEGLDETGRVELGQVAFLPGPRRIGERKATVGQAVPEGAEILETTSTRRVVEVELEVGKQALARRGDGVRVTLPGGATVRGRITRVGHVAHASAGAGDGATGDQELVVDVSIALRSTRGTGRYDQAPVSVALASERRRGALAVPVEALLARRGGGYAVELAAGGRLVPVRTGLFADGLVAIAGRGIEAGTRVRVPE